MNYLIDIPNRNNGIYIIINIVEKKAYIGLAQNMLNRTQDHYLAICNTLILESDGKKISDDNKNLIAEPNKYFLHFAIDQEKEEIDSYDLQNLESIYITIMRDVFKFELYNIAKKGISVPEIESRGYTKINYINYYKKKVKKVDDEFKRKTGYFLSEVANKNFSERKEIWKSIVDSYKNSNSRTKFCLDSANGNFTECDNYQLVISRFKSFTISKEILKSLNIEWEEKSIKDKDLQLNRMAIISNFGSHNEEIPYEILKKMDIDLKRSSDGCAYWALKKVNEKDFREKIQNAYTENNQVFLLLKTTRSDNSGGKKVDNKIDMVMTEEQILKNDDLMNQYNKPDLMHSYYIDETNEWKPLPNGLTYVTIPTYANYQCTGMKSVAFKIKKFYTCAEYFSFKEMFEKMDRKNSQQGTYDIIITEDILNQVNLVDHSNDIECIFAELEYPYIVEVSNTPGLELYLSGRFNCESKERIVFQLDGIGNNSRFVRAFAFSSEETTTPEKNVVYVYNIDERESLTFKNIITDTDDDLFNEIKDYGKKYSYKVRCEEKAEIIDIIESGKCYYSLQLDRNSNVKQPRALAGDTHKYYHIQDVDHKTMYAFRYEKIKLKGPLFVFDEVSRPNCYPCQS